MDAVELSDVGLQIGLGKSASVEFLFCSIKLE